MAKSGSKIQRGGSKSHLVHAKPKQKIHEFKKLLNSIYNSVNLNTTCNHTCTCCNISCPQMGYSEFSSVINDVWNKFTHKDKLALLLTSLEYFFKNDFKKWGMETLVKPCMLLDKQTKLCRCYDVRPLNCRLYGLWPKEDYEKRVARFEKIYEPMGLKRSDLPLNTQCPFVKRVDDSIPLTSEVIANLFASLDKLDGQIGQFSDLQISQKENYRTFHDWLLLKVLGEQTLVNLTTFCMAATKEIMQDQLVAFSKVFTEQFSKDGLPDITKVL